VPLAVCDAVFSIGARYEAVTRPVVRRFAGFIGSALYAPDPGKLVTPREALCLCNRHTDESLATEVFGNRQRTSTRNGVLKTEALRRWLSVLADQNLTSFADILSGRNWLAGVKAIPGQGHAVLSYFLMLSGDGSRIKPDRHILRFCERHRGRLQDLAPIATEPAIEPRRLDYAIWLHASANSGQDQRLIPSVPSRANPPAASCPPVAG
jgi:hypothetical protein